MATKQCDYGEMLHDWFDGEIVNLEVIEEYPETDVMTTWYEGEENDLPNALWSCFYAQILPEGTDATKTKVVCVPFYGVDYKKDLITMIYRLTSKAANIGLPQCGLTNKGLAIEFYSALLLNLS
jgi:hypothetical protein